MGSQHPAAAYHARRSGEVWAKITAAANGIVERGENFTIEAVSEDSGVAKTTIYRQMKKRGHSVEKGAAAKLLLLLVSEDKDVLEKVTNKLIQALRQGIKTAQLPTVAKASDAMIEPLIDPGLDPDDVLQMLLPEVLRRFVENDLPGTQEEEEEEEK